MPKLSSPQIMSFKWGCNSICARCIRLLHGVRIKGIFHLRLLEIGDAGAQRTLMYTNTIA